jgi:hypothetical protein
MFMGVLLAHTKPWFFDHLLVEFYKLRRWVPNCPPARPRRTVLMAMVAMTPARKPATGVLSRAYCSDVNDVPSGND